MGSVAPVASVVMIGLPYLRADAPRLRHWRGLAAPAAVPGRVSMYVCGPTVDGVPHLGHGRFSLVFDVLRRYLLFIGLDVTYVSNITDIEDKIIDRANALGIGIDEFTATNEAQWWEIMDALGCCDPTRHRMPRPMWTA